MMRQTIKFVLLLFTLPGFAQATLPTTPLEPVYHALFTQRNDLAWRQLINLWPQLTSATERTAWQQALEAVISGQCGNDLPVTVPSWLDQPTLVLTQRDMPLNRIYRIQLNGMSTHRDLRVSLRLPSGEEIWTNTEMEYATDGQFRLDSQERDQPFPAGVYQLTVRSGADVWQPSLALQGSGRLNWIQLRGQQIHIQRPPTPLSCPAPWLVQSLLRRSDYAPIWWERYHQLYLHPWPIRNDTDALWAHVSVIRTEAQGALTIRMEHRLAGPLRTLKN